MNKIFQSETITCRGLFREHIQFRTQFTRVPWSSKKNAEVGYGLIKGYGKHVNRIITFFYLKQNSNSNVNESWQKRSIILKYFYQR